MSFLQALRREGRTASVQSTATNQTSSIVPVPLYRSTDCNAATMLRIPYPPVSSKRPTGASPMYVRPTSENYWHRAATAAAIPERQPYLRKKVLFRIPTRKRFRFSLLCAENLRPEPAPAMLARPSAKVPYDVHVAARPIASIANCRPRAHALWQSANNSRFAHRSRAILHLMHNNCVDAARHRPNSVSCWYG